MNNIEHLPENREVILLNSNHIDSEPFYDNFTTIENLLARQTQSNHRGIFNLIDIVEEIGYRSQSICTRSTQINELYKIILEIGGANGPLVNRSRLNLDKEYFQRWYQKKYTRSASMICSPTNHISNENQSNISKHHPSINRSKQMNEKDVLRWYGIDDNETESSISSRRSSIDESSRQSTPVENPQPKQQIIVREYYANQDRPSLVVSGSNSSSSTPQQQQQQLGLSDQEYEQIIRNHPDVFQDPYPELITKPNPDQVTYQQNVSIRYLVPPTPPPPGPLIIREILPPRAPSPPPLVITQQDPRSSTPPPLIIRERPPTPPAQQEAQVITKILPQEPATAQRVIIERTPPLPPKPQSIIIEKWLPYKPPPPREIIYERITEDSRIPIPVHFEYDNSIDYNSDCHNSSLFDQFAWSTQQHLNRIQAQQQWTIDQHQNFYRQMSSHLTTPALIVNHPPMVRTITASSFFHNEQQFINETPTIYPVFM